ncbi:MAG: phage virion morphogenesis protein [Campylobacterales bacterium]|nr:phage virion morphogenesis protein [Campylobacterales bacterium]
MDIKLDIGDAERGLRKIIARGEDMTPAMRDISKIMELGVMDNFNEEGRPSWKPLSSATKRKQEQHKILQDTRQLRMSIVNQYSAKTAEVGTNKEYGAIHQFGGKAGRGRKVEIPAREYLRITEDETTEIIETVKDYLVK